MVLTDNYSYVRRCSFSLRSKTLVGFGGATLSVSSFGGRPLFQGRNNSYLLRLL